MTIRIVRIDTLALRFEFEVANSGLTDQVFDIGLICDVMVDMNDGAPMQVFETAGFQNLVSRSIDCRYAFEWFFGGEDGDLVDTWWLGTFSEMVQAITSTQGIWVQGSAVYVQGVDSAWAFAWQDRTVPAGGNVTLAGTIRFFDRGEAVCPASPSLISSWSAVEIPTQTKRSTRAVTNWSTFTAARVTAIVTNWSTLASATGTATTYAGTMLYAGGGAGGSDASSPPWWVVGLVGGFLAGLLVGCLVCGIKNRAVANEEEEQPGKLGIADQVAAGGLPAPAESPAIGDAVAVEFAATPDDEPTCVEFRDEGTFLLDDGAEWGGLPLDDESGCEARVHRTAEVINPGHSDAGSAVAPPPKPGEAHAVTKRAKAKKRAAGAGGSKPEPAIEAGAITVDEAVDELGGQAG